jgi:deoxyribodipyrimidine photo-lyase
LKYFGTQKITDLVAPDVTLVWLRRDLRLEDNCALFRALSEQEKVLLLFIFDTEILNKLEDKTDKRVEFIWQSLVQIKEQAEKAGSSLLVVHGKPIDFFSAIKPKAVYTNHDYEPYARQRDASVLSILKEKQIPFFTFKDQVIFEKNEVVKDDNKPYTVFTPYAKKWKSKLVKEDYTSFNVEKLIKNLLATQPLAMPSLTEIGFILTQPIFPKRIIKQSIITNYHEVRNFPSVEGTTKLSVHLRFGTISIRKLVSIAIEKNETWLNELIWRDFYHMILWHFPHVEKQAFKPAYDAIEWRNNETEFEAWCNGTTGYPIVDAGMRELNQTGFMHNRVRMITASFLIKHLLIDWRWGEAYFAKKLLDFDLAANNGGWQWAASSGCDAAPYFRVFNPLLQTEKFDPDYTYIKHWVPEFGTPSYPKPIVEHTFARNRVLQTYKSALT